MMFRNKLFSKVIPIVLKHHSQLFTRHYSIPSKRLDGKVAIVTGGGSGIGRAIAVGFSKEGAKVGITDQNKQTAKETAEIIHLLGGQAYAVEMDVCDEQQVDLGVQNIIKKFGKLDVMICNAGIQFISSVNELSYSDWKRVLSVHLDGAFLCTRAALKQMYKPENGGGSIIYMGSVHSKEASVLKAPYVAAKHGIIGLARTVAKEGASKNVRTNVICPGFVLTPLVEKQIPEQAKTLGISEDEVVKNVMLKNTVDSKFTTIDDVVEATIFFASYKTNALTGQSLIVSHGWHME